MLVTYSQTTTLLKALYNVAMPLFTLMDGRAQKKVENVVNIIYYAYLQPKTVLGICSYIILVILSKKDHFIFTHKSDLSFHI